MRPVLVVEDNPQDADLTLMALGQVGVKNPIELARDGAAALERLRDGSKPAPVVVLLDLKLPRVSGLEVLERLRADGSRRTVPVVVLSSSREESDLRTSYELGANAYVSKAVNFEVFTEAVRQTAAFWLEVNEPPPIAHGSERT